MDVNKEKILKVTLLLSLGFSFFFSFLTLESIESDNIATYMGYLFAKILVEELFGLSAFFIPYCFFFYAYQSIRSNKICWYNDIFYFGSLFNVLFFLNVFLVSMESIWNSSYGGYFPKLIHTLIISQFGSQGLTSNILTTLLEFFLFVSSLCFFFMTFEKKIFLVFFERFKKLFYQFTSKWDYWIKNSISEFKKGDKIFRVVEGSEQKEKLEPIIVFLNENINIPEQKIKDEEIFLTETSIEVNMESPIIEEIVDTQQSDNRLDILEIEEIFSSQSIGEEKKVKSFPWDEIKTTEELSIEKPNEVILENKLDSKEKEEEYFFKEENIEYPMVMNNVDITSPFIRGNKNTLIKQRETSPKKIDKNKLLEKGRALERSLKDFSVGCKIEKIVSGPVVTQYQISIDSGVKVSKVIGLSDNIALALSASSVRISSIPEKGVLGIEVPNESRELVRLGDLTGSDEFKNTDLILPVAMGKSIIGKVVVKDVTEMPHLLVAGATGSGKSVCVNGIITSLLLHCSKEELRLLMVDPKMVELTAYNDIPHLLTPVITNPNRASESLKWVIREMELRYKLLEKFSVRGIKNYNEVAKEKKLKTMPYIMIVIDEFADLMMVCRKEIEDSISRLAAMSRAVGIHLLLATQRPSVDVITGVIKANFPSRIAFQVSSKIDSRTILDEGGADQLLGKGDLLYSDPKMMGIERMQCGLLSDQEVCELVNDLKSKGERDFFCQEIFKREKKEEGNGHSIESDLFEMACEIVIKSQKISTSYLQRKLKIGYNRAATLVEEMEEKGIISSAIGNSRGRKVLIRNEEF